MKKLCSCLAGTNQPQLSPNLAHPQLLRIRGWRLVTDLVDQRQEEGWEIHRCQLLQNLDKALQISGLQLSLRTQGALPDHPHPDLEGQGVLEDLAVQQTSLEQVPDRGRVEQQEKSLLQLRQSPELLVTSAHLVDSEQTLCQSDQFNLVTD